MNKKRWILTISVNILFVFFSFGEISPSLSPTNIITKSPSFLEQIKDSKDGKIDFSKYIGSAHGFLPIPIVITEPAVGFGGGAALLFLHDSIKNRIER